MPPPYAVRMIKDSRTKRRRRRKTLSAKHTLAAIPGVRTLNAKTKLNQVTVKERLSSTLQSKCQSAPDAIVKLGTPNETHLSTEADTSEVL